MRTVYYRKEIQSIYLKTFVVDEQSKEFTLDCEKFIANIKEYTIPGADQKRYVADFEYMGIHYQLKGCLPKEELEEILKNLIFF